MSYINAYTNRVPDDEAIVDLILSNKTAAQFIEQFNASEYIDFFGYSLDVCASYCEDSNETRDYFKAVQIVPALFDRVLCELPQHASAKIKKYAATQDAWKLFAVYYEDTFSAATTHVKELVAAYIAASHEEYATFKSYFNVARALESNAEATSRDVGRNAFDMYSANQVDQVEQIELPALEF